MKRVILMVLPVLMVLSVACGSSSSKTTQTDSAPEFALVETIDATTMPFSLIYGHNEPIIYDNKAWYLGVTKAPTKIDSALGHVYIWSSPDMKTWTNVANVLTFPFDYDDASMFVFKNRIYAAGPEIDSSIKGLWWTTDGANYTRVTEFSGLPFEPTGGFSPVEYDGKIWMVGSGYAAKIDMDTTSTEFLYSSSDGYTWNQVSGDETWPFDTSNCSKPIVYDGKLCVFGYSKVSTKIDGSTIPVVIFSTLNGVLWTSFILNLYSAYNLSFSPGFSKIFIYWNAICIIAFYMTNVNMKADGAPSEEGEVFASTFDYLNWTYGPMYSAFGQYPYDSVIFALNNLLYVWDDNSISVLSGEANHSKIQ